MTLRYFRPSLLTGASVLGVALSFWACSSAGGETEEAGESESSTDVSNPAGLPGAPGSTPGGGIGSDGLAPVDTSAPERFKDPTDGCGDGVLQDDEACDHGIADINSVTDPGCWANCRNVDDGYFCTTPGAACTQFAVCGDGVTVFPEQCDDGGVAGGDGCSSKCKYEQGFKCQNNQKDANGLTQPSTCSATTCGDDLVEGAELCEPGLDAGCTAQCTFAPNCAGNNGCTSACGDGLVLGDEQCDDGNTTANDGCSPTCTVETGYTCQVPECELDEAGNCVQNVPVVYRDFSHNHPDFGPDPNKKCGNNKKNAVETALDADGKPVPTSVANGDACMTALGTEWYRDTDKSVRFNETIKLYQGDDGSFVNRFGSNGEAFYMTSNIYVDGVGQCQMDDVICGPHDGSPAFLPLSGREGALDDGGDGAAFNSSTYGGGGANIWFTNDGGQVTAGAMTPPANVSEGNFSFTSEITYWFAFDDDTNATFDFSGDDDVWVFVNGQLAIDLGGRHAALQDSFTLNGSSPSYGMTTGNIYEIKMFHAERQAAGSNFKLTLSGFNAARSECSAECGDGIIGFGEECDNGMDNVEVDSGVYGTCNTACALEGGFCGNGEVDEGEDCDDQDPATSGSCVNCRILILR